MKANIFLKELFAKTQTLNEELSNSLETLEGELPDSVAETLNNILTSNSAKSNKEIASFFEKRFSERLTKAQIQKLQEAGFTESEIEKIKNTPAEARPIVASQLADERLKKEYSASVDERLAQYQKQMEEYENKVQSYQKALLEKDKYYAGVIETVKMETDLNNFISTIQFRKDGVPREAAIKLLKDELKTQLELMDAGLTFINGYPKLVKKDDPTLDYYDEGNNPVDAARFIYSLATKLNIVEQAQGTSVKKEPRGYTPIVANRVNTDGTSRVASILNKIRSA
jgi:DNA-binding transcriptional MerR regulator